MHLRSVRRFWPTRYHRPSPASTLAGGVPSPELAPTAARPPHSGSTCTLCTTIVGGAWWGVAPPTAASGPGEFAAAVPRPSNVCPNCRSPVDFHAAYCPKCGVSLWEPPLLHYAPFWRRVVAALIDLAIIAVATQVLQVVLWLTFLGRSWLAEDSSFVIWLFYHSILESSSEQATWGKRLTGIMVCGSDGRRLKFPRAVIRTLAKILSLMICGVGFVMPLLTLRRQALHDVLTDAVVVCK